MPPPTLLTALRAALDRRASKSLKRRLLLSTGVDMSSNDYLGLARSRALLREVDTECRRHREDHWREGDDDSPFAREPLLGSTGSRLLSGNSAYYEEVEREVAAFFDARGGA